MEAVKQLADKLKGNISEVIVGKEDIIEQVIIALFAEGHMLLEDVPGTGKTVLARSLAQSLSINFKRVQFTPDLLPTDLSGVHLYNQKEGDFVFKEGPLFTQLLLADEINRATPRTQSALLECMEEKQISINGETKQLLRPFFVIATQNPIEQQGTFPLPEAQLDRFLMRVSIGYPEQQEGIELLSRFMHSSPLQSLKAVTEAQDIINAINLCKTVKASEDVLAYIIHIVEATRSDERIATGVSPRGSQALLRAAQAKAAIEGRTYITPDDVKRLAIPVLAHRLVLKGINRSKLASEQLLGQLIATITIPTEIELTTN